MITSKERAELRTQANTLQTTLQVGKGGISDALIQETEKLLDAKELIKGNVLESALLTAKEACDALCEATGAEGIQVVGNKFVIWRKSEKLEKEKKAAKPAAKKPTAKKVNPVKAGIQKRRNQAKQEKKRREEYFREAAVKAAIERRKQKREDQ